MIFNFGGITEQGAEELVKKVKGELERRTEYDEDTDTMYFNKEVDFHKRKEVDNYEVFTEFLDSLSTPSEPSVNGGTCNKCGAKDIDVVGTNIHHCTPEGANVWSSRSIDNIIDFISQYFLLKEEVTQVVAKDEECIAYRTALSPYTYSKRNKRTKRFCVEETSLLAKERNLFRAKLRKELGIK